MGSGGFGPGWVEWGGLTRGGIMLHISPIPIAVTPILNRRNVTMSGIGLALGKWNLATGLGAGCVGIGCGKNGGCGGGGIKLI